MAASSNFVATKWTNNGATATPLDDPAAIFSAAVGVSPDGSLIGGLASDATGTWACAWLNDNLTFIDDDQGLKFFGQVNGITDDGLFAGGGLFGIDQEAFVWHTGWPNAITLEDWLQQHGIVSPPAMEEVRDVFYDGASYHFAVNGATSAYYVQVTPADSPWTDLGGGSSGSDGQPSLVGTGTLVGGTPTSLSLTNAPASAAMLAWVSFASVPQNFFGGTIHATPFTNQFLFAADGAGAFSASTTWPVGVPAGAQAWFQFIVQDFSVIHGLTLSNGLRMTAP